MCHNLKDVARVYIQSPYCMLYLYNGFKTSGIKYAHDFDENKPQSDTLHDCVSPLSRGSLVVADSRSYTELSMSPRALYHLDSGREMASH